MMPGKKQGYKARLNERLGMTRGKQSGKKMSAAGRRKVSKGVRGKLLVENHLDLLELLQKK